MGSGWNFNGSTTNESILKPLCQQVEEILQIPDRKWCRYFATADFPDLVRTGPYLSGFQAPASVEWPWHGLESQRPSFDHLVYIRNTTCLDPTGCTITYAHELQHVIQHRLYPKLLEVNRALRYYLPEFKPTASEIDLPAEVDANIASKRVAEVVCGTDAVARFADGRVRSMHATGAAAGPIKPAFLRRGKMIHATELHNTTISALITLRHVAVGRLRFGKIVKEFPNLEVDQTLVAASERFPNFDIAEKELGVIVWENAVARIPLTRDLFTGPYDERWSPKIWVPERFRSSLGCR